MNIEIANRLVEMRKSKGLSQEALAEELGISRQAVSKWERAESSPDTSNLITLAKLYGVSLDELLNTDQEQFESGEPKGDAPEADDEGSEKDYVYIGPKGIHVKDEDTEVHIGWKGIHVIEDGKEEVRIGKGGVWVDGEDYSHYNWKADGIFSLVVFCIWLWIGFEYALWHPGWLLFLTVPIISSFVQAIKRKKANSFAYPVLVALVYLYLGFVEQIWHPSWLLFVTIPVWYYVINLFNRKS